MHDTLHTLPAWDTPALQRRAWTVGRLLREAYPHLRLRERVVNHPFLETVTVRDLLTGFAAVELFLAECRMLPQCGDTQIIRLRDALQAEFNLQDAIGADEPPPVEAPPPTDAAPPAKVDDGATSAKVEGHFHIDTVEAVGDVYVRMWRLAQFTNFVYLPVSVPEFVKTPRVLFAELDRRAASAVYGKQLSSLRANMSALKGGSGLILLDRQIMLSIFERRGRYARLTRLDIAEQKTALRGMCDTLPKGIESLVVDFEVARLSPGAIIGDHVVLYGMGGYLTMRNPPMLGHFLDTCNAARDGAQTLSAFLDGQG